MGNEDAFSTAWCSHLVHQLIPDLEHGQRREEDRLGQEMDERPILGLEERCIHNSGSARANVLTHEHEDDGLHDKLREGLHQHFRNVARRRVGRDEEAHALGHRHNGKQPERDQKPAARDSNPREQRGTRAAEKVWPRRAPAYMLASKKKQPRGMPK
jgi:hypothetical protein